MMTCFRSIIDLISLLASFGVIAMTYHVYKLNYRHTQIDDYLKQIIHLYYLLEDDAKILRSYGSDLIPKDKLGECYRRIETNATLMRYYVKEYPIYYNGKEEFVQVINSLSHSPENQSDYDKLGDEFKKFCKNIERPIGIKSLVGQLIKLKLKKLL